MIYNILSNKSYRALFLGLNNAFTNVTKIHFEKCLYSITATVEWIRLQDKSVDRSFDLHPFIIEYNIVNLESDSITCIFLDGCNIYNYS